jgi:hypothetical protein
MTHPTIRPARADEYDEVAEPLTGFTMKYYRWKKEGTAR